jgi:SAM-dependent methyltransferase
VLPSRELGLALGLIVGRHLLGMEDLHYGYWPDDLELTPANLPRAQACYTDFLLEQFPSGARRVLDVGCGAGNTAARLVQLGYEVDCISPNPTLNQVVRERLGDQVGLFEGRFEDFQTQARYDLILFSESLLFIHLRPGLERARELLAPGGHVLISDLFRTTTERGPIGGGHVLETFRATLADLPWEVVADHDVTARIAPTFDLLAQGYRALRPAYDLVKQQVQRKYPFWAKLLLRGRLRARLERYEQKHFSGQRDGAAFQRFKSYRVLLLRLQGAGQGGSKPLPDEQTL